MFILTYGTVYISVEDAQELPEETEKEDVSQNAAETEDTLLIKPNVVATLEGRPMDPSMEGSLGVSASWAILNGNSEGNSPHLSPISSEASLGKGEGESDSVMQKQDIEMSGYESISSDITESTGMVNMFINKTNTFNNNLSKGLGPILLAHLKYNLLWHNANKMSQ